MVNLSGVLAWGFLVYALPALILTAMLTTGIAWAVCGRRIALRCGAISLLPLLVQAAVVTLLIAVHAEDTGDYFALPAPLWTFTAVVYLLGTVVRDVVRARQEAERKVIEEWDVDDPDPF